MTLDSKVPPGPLEQKWDRYRSEMKLVNPANKRKFHIIVVGTGLAGGSAAACGCAAAGTRRQQSSGSTACNGFIGLLC